MLCKVTVSNWCLVQIIRIICTACGSSHFNIRNALGITCGIYGPLCICRLPSMDHCAYAAICTFCQLNLKCKLTDEEIG
ncbi:hypothetical protein EMCRGX_G008760 [Ephydatia muelleri]